MHGNMTRRIRHSEHVHPHRVVLTNKTPTGLNRGFGGPQIYFPLERLIQRIAITLGLDPLDVIRCNLVPSAKFPYRTTSGALLDSGDYAAALASALAGGGHDELLARREAARAAGRFYGIGLRGCGGTQRVQHGLYHHGADPAERRRADRRTARKRRRQSVWTQWQRQRACRVGAARAGTPDSAVPGGGRRFRSDTRRYSCHHRHGHIQGCLVDRVRKLCQPLRPRGRRPLPTSRRPSCATSLPASRPDS